MPLRIQEGKGETDGEAFQGEEVEKGEAEGESDST